MKKLKGKLIKEIAEKKRKREEEEEQERKKSEEEEQERKKKNSRKERRKKKKNFARSIQSLARNSVTGYSMVREYGIMKACRSNAAAYQHSINQETSWSNVVYEHGTRRAVVSITLDTNMIYGHSDIW